MDNNGGLRPQPPVHHTAPAIARYGQNAPYTFAWISWSVELILPSLLMS